MVSKSRYQIALTSLIERLLAELRDQLRSVILFGSVARGELESDGVSDIDILIIADAPFETKQRAAHTPQTLTAA